LKELVSDITYDRSIITRNLRNDIDLWKQFFKDIDDENAQRVAQGKKPKGLGDFTHPAFLSFIRTPHCASFSIKAKGTAKPVDFLAVNAHTLFGNSKTERNREFNALLDWLVKRAKASKRMYYKNMILLADLNMQFNDADAKYSDIVIRLLELNSNLLSGQNAARVNFPFLNVHPSQTNLSHTNARSTETFDHIAFFIDKNEKGLPKTEANLDAGKKTSNDYDYGVFDFTELFSEALHDKPFLSLTKTQRNSLMSKTRADVSDHMPIWARIPIPGA
ncbi:MAG: hypothetical protein AAFV54_12005, partial [Pseudomonadota bacterium]